MSYYLTKSNPNRWRLQDYLRSRRTNCPEWWSDVCKDAKPGDTLFIGLSGKEAGIYAKATITSPPYIDTPDPEFYVDPEDRKERLGAGINIGSFQNLIDRPILEPNLVRIPALKRVARWLHVQGARCCLTAEEAEALSKLI